MTRVSRGLYKHLQLIFWAEQKDKSSQRGKRRRQAEEATAAPPLHTMAGSCAWPDSWY